MRCVTDPSSRHQEFLLASVHYWEASGTFQGRLPGAQHPVIRWITEQLQHMEENPRVAVGSLFISEFSVLTCKINEDHWALSAPRTQLVDVEEHRPEAMDVKERKPYRSLTRRRDAERRYTSSSADSEEGKAPQKSYSSSETLKAYDQDARLAYGSRIKDVVPQEAEEFCHAGANFTLRELGLGEVTPPHGTLYRRDVGLPHCGYSLGASSDADLEADTVLSPEHPVRLWGRSTRSGRSSCLSSRANSNLTLTDTEHENTETAEKEAHTLPTKAQAEQAARPLLAHIEPESQTKWWQGDWYREHGLRLEDRKFQFHPCPGMWR
ncbi:Teneurin-4 [Fukomys damarensis]|uniref:Teneurin-4 n=1 Tax=Fukomys damarensis TaxID=885580 RepID=A0A091DZG8_FUKDA|nr:Teneurin-4 [Fukomys damarensis]